MKTIVTGRLALTSVVGLALCLALSACSRSDSFTANGVTVTSGTKNNVKVTQANGDRIQQGMNEADVSSILGNPSFTSTHAAQGKSVKVAVWQNGDNHITVTFQEGKVQAAITQIH